MEEVERYLADKITQYSSKGDIKKKMIDGLNTVLKVFFIVPYIIIVITALLLDDGGMVGWLWYIHT